MEETGESRSGGDDERHSRAAFAGNAAEARSDDEADTERGRIQPPRRAVPDIDDPGPYRS